MQNNRWQWLHGCINPQTKYNFSNSSMKASNFPLKNSIRKQKYIHMSPKKCIIDHVVIIDHAVLNGIKLYKQQYMYSSKKKWMSF